MGTRRASTCSYQYYTCPTRYIMGGKCQNKVCIAEKKVEQYIMGTLTEKVERRRFERSTEMEAAKRKDYKAEIATVRGKLRRLKELYVNDLISLDEYKLDHASLSARLDELSKMDRPVHEPDLSGLEIVTTDGWAKDYQELSQEQKRNIWRAIIKEIRVYPDRHIEFDLAF